MTSDTHAPMLGHSCPDGPGGRDCTCCGQAPGLERKVRRRTQKRRERQATRKMINKARDEAA